jgi:cytochrome c oxidase cbb3-type subunit 3
MKKIKNIFSFLMAMGLGNVAFAQDVVSTSNPNMHYYLLTALAVILIVLILVLNSAISGLASNKSIIAQLKDKSKVATIAALVFLGLSSRSMAQDMAGSSIVVVEPNYGVVFWMFLIVDLVLIIIVVVQLSVLNGLARALKGEAEAIQDIKVVEPSGLGKFWEKLTDAVPLDREEEIMTDHEYDGIKELDNKLPPWWVWMFNLSIIFGVIYFAYYEVFSTSEFPSSITEYNQEMIQAEEELAAYKAKFGSGVDELTAVLLTDPASIQRGKEIFEVNCVSCHMADGGGGIGPNFTDAYWIHGGDIKDLFKTIKYGVITKGMIPWKDQLKPDQIQEVASYILTAFPGTTPEKPKDPQGDLYVP